MKKRILALSMAAVTALTSTSIVAFADNENSEALAAAITLAKSRIDIPEELTEFTYSVSNQNLKTVFYLTWSTPRSTALYKSADVTVCGDLILSYRAPTDWSKDNSNHFAKLTGDQLYKKAKAQLKKIDPSIYNILSIDRDSLNISLYGSRASFSVVRTRNGIPVQNDSGRIVIDKDTGELISFNLNWHQNASFQNAKNAISEDKAKEAYADMIGLYPQYEFDYDYETGILTPTIVYRQSDYGEINAFTGKKSDFYADGYYDENEDSVMEETEEAADNDKGNPSTGGGFTPAEKDEITKNLPYGSKDAVIKLLKENEWFTYYDDMTLRSYDSYSTDLNGKKTYIYSAIFTDENWDEDEIYWDEEYCSAEAIFDEPEPNTVVSADSDSDKISHTVSISVNAETGEVLAYTYSDSNLGMTTFDYDMAAADAKAKKIASTFAGDKYGAYADNYTSDAIGWIDAGVNKQIYMGSCHSWTRYENGIKVSGDDIVVSFNKDMLLTDYHLDYTDIALPSPKGMLTEKQAMKKFWENNDLNLYYLAKVNKKKTKTVLVYGTDYSVYIDAFTGEPVYQWQTRKGKNDFSGITDKKLLKMAQKLDDHGILISEEKFSQDDAVTYSVFESVTSMYTSTPNSEERKMTRSAALIAYTRSLCGDDVAKIKGIYKSPFSDISDDNPRVGYYAIAYGMGVFTEKKLDPTAYFTYGDLIKMIYAVYSA